MEKVVKAVPGILGRAPEEGRSAFQAEGPACVKARGTTPHDVSGWGTMSPLVLLVGTRKEEAGGEVGEVNGDQV